MSQEQSGLIYCFYFYVPCVKQPIFKVVGDNKIIGETMEALGEKIHKDMKNMFAMAGGVILNKSLTFNFYKDQIEAANKIVSIVSSPSARKVPKLPIMVQNDKFKFKEEEKLKAQQLQKIESPYSRKLKELLNQVLELKKIFDE